VHVNEEGFDPKVTKKNYFIKKNYDAGLLKDMLCIFLFEHLYDCA